MQHIDEMPMKRSILLYDWIFGLLNFQSKKKGKEKHKQELIQNARPWAYNMPMGGPNQHVVRSVLQQVMRQ